MKRDVAINEIISEHERASKLFPDFHSNHEGYAVIKEEMDELWDEIKRIKDITGNDKIKKELIQVAAMALRYLTDLCN